MSIFTQVKHAKVNSNTFDLSHDRKMSMKMGELTPILNVDVLPGDKFKINTSQLLRFAPMLAPIMHNVTVYTHFFFVPNRILWREWKGFITGDPQNLTTPTADAEFPKVSVNQTTPVGSLADYLGLPVGEPNSVNNVVSAMPFAAYQKIFEDYYRDQNLIEKDVGLLPLNSGVLTSQKQTKIQAIKKRAWQHDYFTSALPWTQKGPEATIPLGLDAPINFKVDDRATGNLLYKNDGNQYDKEGPLGTYDFNGTLNDYALSGEDIGSQFYPLHLDNSPDLSVDLSQATAASINDLRQAFKLQEWLERQARGGTRYIEQILSHFGVKSSDSRLQRPEYLGGGSAPVQISEVLQTSDNVNQNTPQGNMAGHGISVGQASNVTYRAEEHGIIMGIMSIMPKTSYSQGVDKKWQKFDKFDYYWPSFAHLGEQPILNKELYCDKINADDLTDEEVFGYTPRYAEYKFMNSSIHGEMRTTLDFWHMGRYFDNRPLLNQEFIECNPTDRIFAVQNTEQIYIQIYHNIKARRLMPYFGTPRL